MNISLIIFDTGEPIDSNQANPNENNRTLSLVFRYDSDLNENNFNFYADERYVCPLVCLCATLFSPGHVKLFLYWKLLQISKWT